MLKLWILSTATQCSSESESDSFTLVTRSERLHSLRARRNPANSTYHQSRNIPSGYFYPSVLVFLTRSVAKFSDSCSDFHHWSHHHDFMHRTETEENVYQCNAAIFGLQLSWWWKHWDLLISPLCVWSISVILYASRTASVNRKAFSKQYWIEGASVQTSTTHKYQMCLAVQYIQEFLPLAIS